MTDGTDRAGRIRHGNAAEAESSVETLASRALSVLASKRISAASLLSERFLGELSAASLASDPGRRMGVLQDMLDARIRREDIVDFYIPEVARRMGEAWCEDGMSFADVTIGVARLQGMLRDVGRDWFDNAALDPDAPGILLVVLADEFHTLGSMVLSGQLRRMGISVRLLVGQPDAAIVTAVADGHYDAVLMSVSTGESLARLRKLVEKMRAAAVRQMPIVIGGSVVTRETDATKRTGADYATADPREALRLCGLRISVPGARRRATSE